MFYLVPTLKHFERLLLLSLLLLVPAGPVAAQDGPGPPATTAAAAHGAAGSNREQDGLVGPVRRVRTEIASLLPKDGKFVENSRVLLEMTTYDRPGNRVDTAIFAVSSTTLIGKEIYKYDDKGNIVEMTVRDDNGSIVSQEIYAYEFDAMGNWTKMTTSVAVIENGHTTYEPVEVTYRTITYYRTDAVAKIIRPAAPATERSEPASARLPSGSGASEAGRDELGPEKVVGEKVRAAAGESEATGVPAGPGASSVSEPPVSHLSETGSDVETRGAREGGNTEREGRPVAEPPAPKPPVKAVSGGVLNGRAIKLPRPLYPERARSANLTGTVSVEVLIDVTGKVISAKAVSGPEILRRAAEDAARKAQFIPTLLSGQPVRIAGVINYNFLVK